MPGKTSRSRTGALGVRKSEMIRLAEMVAGITHITSASFGATAKEIVMATSRQLLGFKATSAPLRSAIESVLHGMLLNGDLSREHCQSSDEPAREATGPSPAAAAAAS